MVHVKAHLSWVDEAGKNLSTSETGVSSVYIIIARRRGVCAHFLHSATRHVSQCNQRLGSREIYKPWTTGGNYEVPS